MKRWMKFMSLFYTQETLQQQPISMPFEQARDNYNENRANRIRRGQLEYADSRFPKRTDAQLREYFQVRE